MKRVLMGKDGEERKLPPSPKGIALACLLFLSGLFLAGPAMASHTYRLVGGECTDSNRPEVFYPDARPGGAFGPGPTLCSKQISAEITMADGYVPGTSFDDRDEPGAKHVAQSFSFSDGSRSESTNFPLTGDGFGRVDGTLPASMQAGPVDVTWVEGWFFRTLVDGTWLFGVEFGAHEGVCGLGSIEGPNLSGNACTETNTHYYSTGTYQGWLLVPEPATLASLALALGVLASLRLRRQKTLHAVG